MAEEANETQVAAEAPKGGMMKMLVFGVVGVLLLVVGIFAGGPIRDMLAGSPAAEGEVQDESVVQSSEPAIYYSLHPPLVVNLVDTYGESHYMQITLEVMARDQDVIDAVREHTPAIRSALILFFGTAVYAEIITREGKERLLEQALAEIQAVLMQRIGKPGIESAYFTSLIVQ